MGDNPSAISFTRRAYREMADGTLRVQCDIDPQFKEAFLQLFPEIDMKGAMTPLVPEYFARPARTTANPVGGATDPAEEDGCPNDDNAADIAWRKLGPLCKSAIMLCKEPAFQSYVMDYLQLSPSEAEDREVVAADYVKHHCSIQSRKELDENESAAMSFAELMARYRRWGNG